MYWLSRALRLPPLTAARHSTQHGTTSAGGFSSRATNGVADGLCNKGGRCQDPQLPTCLQQQAAWCKLPLLLLLLLRT